MYEILEATFQNGQLIFHKKIAASLEGKRVKVILVEASETDSKKERFLRSIENHSFKLPENYQFRREEFYE